MVAQEESARRAAVFQAALAARRKSHARRGTVSSAHRRAWRKPLRSRRGDSAGESQQQMQTAQFSFNQEENDDYREDTVDDEYKSPPGSPQVELIID